MTEIKSSPRSSGSAMQAVLEAVGGAASGPGPDGTHLAYCPSHHDRTPSLSIRQTDAGVFVRCNSGCTVEEVLSVLGMTTSELFDKKD